MAINIRSAELRVVATKNGVEDRIIIRIRDWCEEIAFEDMDGYSIGASNGNLDKTKEILSTFCEPEDILPMITTLMNSTTNDKIIARLTGQA